MCSPAPRPSPPSVPWPVGALAVCVRGLFVGRVGGVVVARRRLVLVLMVPVMPVMAVVRAVVVMVMVGAVHPPALDGVDLLGVVVVARGP